jgi:hypothetical protein
MKETFEPTVTSQPSFTAEPTKKPKKPIPKGMMGMRGMGGKGGIGGGMMGMKGMGGIGGKGGIIGKGKIGSKGGIGKGGIGKGGIGKGGIGKGGIDIGSKGISMGNLGPGKGRHIGKGKRGFKGKGIVSEILKDKKHPKVGVEPDSNVFDVPAVNRIFTNNEAKKTATLHHLERNGLFPSDTNADPEVR